MWEMVTYSGGIHGRCEKKQIQYIFGSWDWQNLQCEGKKKQALFFAVLISVGFEVSLV